MNPSFLFPSFKPTEGDEFIKENAMLSISFPATHWRKEHIKELHNVNLLLLPLHLPLKIGLAWDHDFHSDGWVMSIKSVNKSTARHLFPASQWTTMKSKKSITGGEYLLRTRCIRILPLKRTWREKIKQDWWSFLLEWAGRTLSLNIRICYWVCSFPIKE